MQINESSYHLLDAMMVYFQGEKLEALVFILPLGLLSLVFGGWLYVDGGTTFNKGVAVPFLLMGLLMTTIGTTVGFRTPAQLLHLQAQVKIAPESTRLLEVKRMEKVNNAWKYYLIVWGLFGVIGLILRFAIPSDFAQGLGIALIFFSGVGMLVDGFAERRTHPYMKTLTEIKFQAQ